MDTTTKHRIIITNDKANIAIFSITIIFPDSIVAVTNEIANVTMDKIIFPNIFPIIMIPNPPGAT